MDTIQTGLTIAMGVVVPSVAFVVGKVFNTDKAIAEHNASDIATFAGFNINFTDIKNDIQKQSEKLDRLIEQNLHRRGDAASAALDVTAAAAAALRVVEHAKNNALEVVAYAAAAAKKVV